MTDFASIELALSVIAILFSGVSFYFLFEERKQTRKREVALKLYEHWNDSHMQERRARVWDYLEQLQEDGRTQKWSQLKHEVVASRKIWPDFSAVDHFIADLNTLLSQNLIDYELASRLYGHTLLEYIKRFELVLEYDTNDEKLWFEERIKPLQRVIARNN